VCNDTFPSRRARSSPPSLSCSIDASMRDLESLMRAQARPATTLLRCILPCAAACAAHA
jgi:hypothetical protein